MTARPVTTDAPAGRPCPGARTRAGRRALALCAAALALSACDDIVGRIGWFATMDRQPSVATYEEERLSPVEGTVPVEAERAYSLREADSLLTNPLEPGPENRRPGAVLYRRFCLPCHGTAGEGDGPLVAPDRFPAALPLDLTSGRARAFSDGYLWGMIANGRGLMPSYRRIRSEDRWRIVLFVRELQDGASRAPE